MRESTIEKYLVKRIKDMGGEVRKVSWIGRRGAPDRLVLLPRKIIWVELKRPGEKAEPHQIREHLKLWFAGQSVVIIDSIEGVDRLCG